MKDNKRVTIQDIANEVNVSYATVSKVLSGKIGGNIRVSEATKNKIIEVSTRLGYVPNHMARNLKKNNLSLISVFTYEDMSKHEIQQEYFEFYIGVYLQGEKLGLDVLFLNTRKNISSSSRVTLSSGAIMIGVERDDSDIKALASRNFPLVFVGRREIPGIKTNWVSFDYKTVILEIFKLLKERNVKQLLFINSVNQAEPHADKQKYLFYFAKLFEISVSVLNLGNSLNIDKEQEKILDNFDYYIVDRIWQLPAINQYLSKKAYTLGKDKFGIVMEDDWLNENKWTCWENKRQELGALATKHLYSILNKKELPSQNLVSLKLVFRDSFRLEN